MKAPPAAVRHRLKRSDGSTYEFDGAAIGFGTSYRDSHLHPPGDLPPPGVRCSGCRWSEVSLYRVDGGTYLIYIVGRSLIPQEQNRIRIIWADGANAVLDGLLVTRPKKFVGNGSLELPQPNHDALEEAARLDQDLNEVLADWRQSYS